MAAVCLFSQPLQVRHKVSRGLKVGRRPTLIGLRTECLAAPSLAAAINGTGPKENWYVCASRGCTTQRVYFWIAPLQELPGTVHLKAQLATKTQNCCLPQTQAITSCLNTTAWKNRGKGTFTVLCCVVQVEKLEIRLETQCF